MVTLTGEQTLGYHYIALKHAVRLQRFGLKHSSGRSARAFAISELGLPRSSTFEQVISALDKKIAEYTHGQQKAALL